MRCAVFNCKMGGSKTRLYSFPKKKELIEKWVRFCNRHDEFKINVNKICQYHFNEDDFQRNLQFEMGKFIIKCVNV